MRLPPTRILSAWPTPNYLDPSTRGTSLVVTSICFMLLISVAVPLRILSRWRKVSRLGLDDIFIIIAYISSMALSIVVIIANEKYQWNRHLWDVELTMFESASIVALIAKIAFIFAATFTRASLICFYFRLVKGTGLRLFNHILWASMIYNCAVGITFVFLSVFLCTPVQAYWEFPPMYNSTCLNEGRTTLVAGILNSISDLIVTILPIPIILGLNIPLKQRCGVIFLLSLGFIVTIAGVIRTYYIWKTLIASYDETWNSTPLFLSATVEIDLAVLCACAPSLKPHFAPIITTVAEMITAVTQRSHSNTSHPSNGNSISRTVTVSQQLTHMSTLYDKPSHRFSVNGNGAAVIATVAATRPRSWSMASSQRTILPLYGDISNSVGMGYGIEESREDDVDHQWPLRRDLQQHVGYQESLHRAAEKRSRKWDVEKRCTLWDIDWKVKAVDQVLKDRSSTFFNLQDKRSKTIGKASE